MKKIYIDSNDFSNFNDFLIYMAEKLMIEQDMLSGLDALEDALEGGFGVFEEGSQIIIKWRDFRKSMDDLGYEETIHYYIKMLKECHPSNRNEVKFILDCAKQNFGPTLFYLILDVFFDSKNISIELF